MRVEIRKNREQKCFKRSIPLVIAFIVIMMPLLSSMTVVEGHHVGVHEEFTMKSIETLYEDDMDYIPEWMKDLDVLYDLRRGSSKADQWDVSKSHYYNPYTGDGLSGFKDARTRFVEKVYDAEENIDDGDVETGIRDLGWALHLLQDMTVPHHTYPTPTNGHSAYEDWVSNNLDIGHVIGNGNYTDLEEPEIDSPGEWIHETALIGYEYMDYVNEDNASEENYTYALERLQPVAIRQGAGFLHWFFNQYIDDGIHISVITRSENDISIGWTQDHTETFESYQLFIAKNETELERKVEENETRRVINSRKMTEYTFSGLEDFETYHIRIRVVRDGQDDTLSGRKEVSTIMSTTKIAVILLIVVVAIFGMVGYKGDIKGRGNWRVKRS